MINYISKPFKWFFKLEAASGLVLLFAAIIALIVSNSNSDLIQRRELPEDLLRNDILPDRFIAKY